MYFVDSYKKILTLLFRIFEAENCIDWRIDRMKIINLVENTPGVPGCGYEHGLSFYVETKKHKLLIDSGATDLFLRNAEVLGVDLREVDIVILSHGHYDHAGGILAFSQMNPNARIYLKDSAGEDYYHLKDREEKYIGIDKEILNLRQCRFVKGDLEIDDELYLFTDIIGRRFPSQGNLSLKRKEAGKFVQDIFDHEQCLVITQDDKRVLLSGCAHSGIVNILERYQEIFHSEPDMAVSGFHLMKEGTYSSQEIQNIQDMADTLCNMGTIFYTGHCTGNEASRIMKEIMGDQLRIIHSGETLIEV